MINKINHWCWERIARTTSVSIESLCAFRIITGLFLLMVFMPDCSWMADVPKAFFNPPLLSPAALLHNIPGRYFFMFNDLAVLVSALCITLGVKARLASWIFVLFSLAGFNFHYSFGKIDHTILLYCLVICLSFSNWGTRLATIPDKKVNIKQDQQALSLFAVLIAFAFFSSGFQKALHWLNADFNKSGTAGWLYSGYYGSDRHFLLAPYGRFFPFFLLKLMDFAAVAIELSPLALLLTSRKAWRIWLLTVCIFHLMNALILNITFLFNMPVYLVFCDFSRLFRVLSVWIHKKTFIILSASVLVLAVVLRLKNTVSHISASNIFFPEINAGGNSYLAVIIWIGAVAVVYNRACKNPTQSIFYHPDHL